MEHEIQFETRTIEVQPEIWIWTETIGNPANPAVILFAPAGGQCIQWPEHFCKELSKQYFVIRFDYRDSGLSTAIDYQKTPYDFKTLFADGLSILDALKIEQAHFIGNSMGGSIIQYGAMAFPERMISMTLMMGSPHHVIPFEILKGRASHYFKLSPPHEQFISATHESAKSLSNIDLFLIRRNVALKAGSSLPGSHFDRHYWYELEEEILKRSTNPNTLSNQFSAQLQHPENRLNALQEVLVKTLIIHGPLDAVYPMDHAEAMAKALPNGKLLMMPDLGHCFDPFYALKIGQAIMKFYET
ncbi:MAG: alpha/beta hydrolase [Gammaproteobacteria bacterium]